MAAYGIHTACWLLLAAACPCSPALAQRPAIDSSRLQELRKPRPKHAPVDAAWLFKDDEPMELLVETDMRRLLKSASMPELQPAAVTIRTYDGTIYREELAIRARGEFRKDFCSIPNILLDFSKHRSQTPPLHARLKVVSPCQYGSRYENLLLREFLAYRIFSLFTEQSFRVRMVKLRMSDTEKRHKPFVMPSFLIEDIDDMAMRNGCHESEAQPFHPDQTDRQQITLIALFQYMIGNTDWAVAKGHNIRLIQKDRDSLSRPIAVPYDFDYCGLVNAPYAIPDERLGIPDVRTRIYMGPPRNLAELRHTRDLFLARKDDVRRLVDTLPGFDNSERKEIWRYLEGFFWEIRQRDFESRFSIGGWGFTQ